MVVWALRTTLETVDTTTLQALEASARLAGGTRLPWLPLVLAGNLFTASVRGVFVPLLLGIPVIAKASSREIRFPTLLRNALRATNHELASAFDVVSFRGGDVELERSMIGDASSIAVYGSDETVVEIARRHSEARVISHGHGLSLGYCSRSSIEDDATFSAVALDVCAYDQRGCLSPQAIYVEGDEADAAVFAKRLSTSLARMSAKLPRGPLPLDVGAAQAQWRGIAEVEGRLLRGSVFAVAVTDRSKLRWSPGFRNVSVVPVESFREALETWSSLGSTLKCIGVDAHSLQATSDALLRSPSLDAYACTVGTMQTPPFDAPADGHPPWHGLFR